MIVISAEEGITDKTKEQYESTLVLDIPFFVVVNKMDLIDENRKNSLYTEIK